MDMLAGNAGAGVGDFDFDAAVVSGGAHFQHSASGHGVASIQEQIEKYLLKFIGRSTHRGQRLAQLLDDEDVRSLQRMRDQRQRLLDHAIYVNVGKFGDPGAREIQQVVDDFAGAKRLLHNFLDDGVTRIIAGHLLGQQLDEVGDDRERRVDFVGHAGGKQSERRELLGLGHLLFHALALGDVVEEQQTANALAGLADQRGNRDVQRKPFAVMLEALLVDAGDLLVIAPRRDFRCQLFREQGAELVADSVLTLDADELLHARVPGFDHAAQIDGEHADVERFDDVFAEILEARDFQRFLFERRVELGVVERHGEVASDGLHEFDVVAGEEIAVDGFAKAEYRDGVLANTAGHEIIQV